DFIPKVVVGEFALIGRGDATKAAVAEPVPKLPYGLADFALRLVRAWDVAWPAFVAEPEDGDAVSGVDFAEQGFGRSEVARRPEADRSGIAGGLAQQLSCVARIDRLKRGGDTHAADEVIE